MQFYHWDWEKMMTMSLKLFWTLVKNMNRIKASENLRYMRLIGMPNTDENGRREYVSQQQATLGKISVSDERDEEGINKLKNL